MAKRSPAKVISQEPEVVSIGGEEFEVRPLVIKYSRKFRRELMGLIQDASKLETSGDLNGILDKVALFFDEQLIALIKMAIPEFNSKDQKWIEENVSEAELQNALGVAVTVNFPWIRKMSELGSLGAMVNK